VVTLGNPARRPLREDLLAVQHARFGGHRRLIGLYLAAAGAAFGGYFLLPDPASAASYLVISVMAVGAIWVGVRLHQPAAARPWLLLAAGQVAFLLGDVIWYADYLPEGSAPPFPSVYDLFYLAGYPLLALGVLLFIRARQPRYRLTAAIDALVIGVAGVLGLWLLVGADVFHDAALPLSERAVTLAYPVGDVLILASAAYLLLSGRHAKGAFYVLVASLAALLTADVAVILAADGQLAEPLSDGLWMASYILFGLTALLPSMRNLTEPSDAPAAPEGARRLVLIGVAMAALPLFGIAQRFVLEREDLFVSGAAAAVLFVALLLRMHELVAIHRRNERRYTSLLTNASDAVAIVRADGTYSYASPTVERVLGYDSTCLVGRSPLEMLHPDSAESAAAMLERVAAVPGAKEEMEWRSRRVDGEWRRLSVVASNRTDDAIIDGIILNYRDVTDQHADRRRIDLQAAMLDEVQHAVFACDTDGRISYWNRAAERLLGYQAGQVLGQPLRSIGLLSADRPSLELLTAVEDGHDSSGEYSLVGRDGTPVTAIVTTSVVSGPAGQKGGVIAVAIDISDRKQLEDQLHQQAFTDGLTGLANRALLLRRMEELGAPPAPGRRRKPFAVLYIDVDDFKAINDSMGHGAGDALLVALGERLGRVLRPSDIAARMGGDEFAILLSGASPAQAEAVARRLLDELSKPVRLPEREVRVTASIGIAVPPVEGAASAVELLRDADLAMYRAKARQHGSYAVYEQGMHEAALRRLELRADLRRALEEESLELEYQPIVRLADGAIVGAEALLRWRHPTRGLVEIVEALSVAESAGLMRGLSDWVLDRACRQAGAWLAEIDRGDEMDQPFVSINAAVPELLDSGYVDRVALSLARNGLPARALAIEITESELMQESESAVTALGRLKDLGVRLAIDDFGTGYSSLAYLARFPLDVIKIDQAFVTGRRSDQDWAIARSIIDLGRSLSLEIIAEGIEHPDEEAMLRSLGAGFGQGYHLGRPMSADEVGQMLAAGARREAAAESSRRRLKVVGAA
jgi:diguanylate cyclase (GGDEF)-like protein/PAS domain S-box-containing protein